MHRFRQQLVHPKIRSVNGKGLLLALEFESEALNREVIARCMEAGLVTDWFLFSPHCLRIAPPLNITREELDEGLEILDDVLAIAGPAVDVLGPDRVQLAPDCGMWFLPRAKAIAKISAMEAAAEVLRARY